MNQVELRSQGGQADCEQWVQKQGQQCSVRDVPGWHLNAVPCWGRQEPTWASGWSVGPGLGALDTTAPEAAENSAGVRKSCTAGVPEPRPGTRQGLWGSANALLRSVLGTKGERARGTGQHES